MGGGGQHGVHTRWTGPPARVGACCTRLLQLLCWAPGAWRPAGAAPRCRHCVVWWYLRPRFGWPMLPTPITPPPRARRMYNRARGRLLTRTHAGCTSPASTGRLCSFSGSGLVAAARARPMEARPTFTSSPLRSRPERIPWHTLRSRCSTFAASGPGSTDCMAIATSSWSQVLMLFGVVTAPEGGGGGRSSQAWGARLASHT